MTSPSVGLYGYQVPAQSTGIWNDNNKTTAYQVTTTELPFRVFCDCAFVEELPSSPKSWVPLGRITSVHTQRLVDSDTDTPTLRFSENTLFSNRGYV